jgi:outer membrane protein assembly factor BamA
MKRAAFILVAAAQVLAAACRGGSSTDFFDAVRLGDFYGVQRFMFEGAKAFTPQTLREALRNTRDFFEVSHPLAPQEAYLETIQRKLLLGYQHHGFPEARIEARADAKAGRVVVTVEEGPRYVCVGIKVSGAQRKLTPRQLSEAETRVAALLASRPKAEETPGSSDTDR